MKPPDPTLDEALERFERECRALFAGRRTLTVEKLGGVTVEAHVERGLQFDVLDGLIRETPNKREAEAEMKRGRRR
jgi:hypothetical protein